MSTVVKSIDASQVNDNARKHSKSYPLPSQFKYFIE